MHPRSFIRQVAAAGFSVLALATTLQAQAQAVRPGSDVRAERASLPNGVTKTTWADGLEHPWGLALLPSGEALVTERPGRLRVIAKDGTLSAPVTGTPQVDARGQGGLLDVVLHPDFARNQWVYLSFSEPGQAARTNSTAVMRGKLAQTSGTWALTETTVIFRQAPKYASSLHFGSRMVFDRDGALFVTLGERSSRSVDAQDLGTHHGKVVRLTDAGKPAPGNPYAEAATQRTAKGALPEIYSLGHRNPQGAALDPVNGELWVAEHGPQGGDEINIVKRGQNYGWPKFTYGEQYGGGKIGEEASAPGYMPPLYSWVPSVSPSGLAFYTSDRIPEWNGSVLLGALSGQALIRLQRQGDRIVKEDRYLSGEARVRNVTVGPQGEVYLLTDAPRGQVIVLRPAGG